jgi:lipid-binding SYLF domain-containing protein
MRRVVELAVVMSMIVAGCAHEPSKPGERADLIGDAQSTLRRIESKDPNLRTTLADSVAYVVFPKVGAGGLIVGGGAGKGVIFEHGTPSGFATVEHAGVGAIAGGAEFAELVIIKDPRVLDQIKHGRFDVGANASAVLLRTGASTAMSFEKGAAVVIEPLRGAMVNASISGQRIHATL